MTAVQSKTVLKETSPLKERKECPDGLQNSSNLITADYVQLWAKTCYEIFLQMISERNDANEVVCVPQVIAMLAFLSEVSDVQCRQTIRERILPKGISTLATVDTAVADYIRQWEHSAQLAAKPGSFNTNRRVLVHSSHSKSYGYDTFMSLKAYGFGVKIAFSDMEREIISWVRRTLKIESMPDVVPFHLWHEDENNDPQTVSNRKCPILWIGSHFDFPIHTNMLDSDKIYSVTFRNHEGGESEVYACRINSGQPFRNMSLNGGSIVVLPSICDNLSVYLITNTDSSQLKNGSQLRDLISKIRTSKEGNAHEITTIYLPLFAEIPQQTTNLALAINRAIESIDKLFQPGGFGDLGCPEGEASPVVGRRQTTNIQSFDYLDLMHLPDVRATEPIPVRSGNDKLMLVNQPFQLVVYDNERDVPLYLARIASPDRSVRLANMTKLVEPMAAERTEADLDAIQKAFEKSAACRVPLCLYTYHVMRGAIRGLFPESPVFVFHRDLADDLDVWMTIRIVRYLPPELTLESNSERTNFEDHREILENLFNELHERFPALLNGERRYLLIGAKPLQKIYAKYMEEKLEGVYRPVNYPTFLYYMNEEQQKQVVKMELPLPEGYKFDEVDPDTDAERITKTWIHARAGDLEQTRSKLRNLPSALIRHEKDGAVAFEMCHPCEFQNHLFVLEEHRQKGLGTAIEMRLSQLCIENGIVPYKTVEFYNEKVIESANKSSIWTRWNYADGAPVHLEYRQYYPKEHYPGNAH
ncbi:hypothetical protein QR680_017624 [Steinernema hermaphroditum]|uniref:Glycine N-acyltransferase-like protein n=1 Tax=Steinernema hermaphroditum TaxID=289476 RepID=A0AA39HHF7_9BILA|nr:hypothetical protein QR680_017624 [Steinernema hermaphroditum]